MRIILFLLGLVVIAGGGALTWYLFPTTSEQGYMPEQPIPFSHALHAGQYNMDCRYCHVTAERSQHASVPSANICMNCHMVVKADSPHIQKLVAAYQKGEPIQWVRVHELPDFVRFSHQSHVTKGVRCEVCHGEVRQMERIVQFAPLTMGWCLGCHRGQNTPDEVRALVKQEVNASKKMPHDQAIAPFQCSTCHY